MSYLEILARMRSPQGAFETIAIIIVQLCVLALVLAVIRNFMLAREF